MPKGLAEFCESECRFGNQHPVAGRRHEISLCPRIRPHLHRQARLAQDVGLWVSRRCNSRTLRRSANSAAAVVSPGLVCERRCRSIPRKRQAIRGGHPGIDRRWTGEHLRSQIDGRQQKWSASLFRAMRYQPGTVYVRWAKRSCWSRLESGPHSDISERAATVAVQNGTSSSPGLAIPWVFRWQSMHRH